VLVVVSMLLALVSANTTCLSAGFKSGACHPRTEGRLAGQYLAGGLAHIGAVEAEPYTAGQHLYVPFADTGVGAGSAGLGAVEASLDTLHQSLGIQCSTARVRLNHPLGVSQDFLFALRGQIG